MASFLDTVNGNAASDSGDKGDMGKNDKNDKQVDKEVGDHGGTGNGKLDGDEVANVKGTDSNVSGKNDLLNATNLNASLWQPQYSFTPGYKSLNDVWIPPLVTDDIRWRNRVEGSESVHNVIKDLEALAIQPHVSRDDVNVNVKKGPLREFGQWSTAGSAASSLGNVLIN